jgi:hypothetical protein
MSLEEYNRSTPPSRTKDIDVSDVTISFKHAAKAQAPEKWFSPMIKWLGIPKIFHRK